MASGKKHRILSVEDNLETRILLEHGLSNSYEVRTVSGVEEAIDAIETDTFDALLLDINISEDRDGIDLLHRLRGREDVAEVRAIAVTAYAMPGERKEILAEGFDAYVAKPFSLHNLRGTVENVLAAS